MTDLNERQRIMLRTIFDTDQARETYYRQMAARGTYPPKASVWRWMDYKTDGYGIDSELKAAIKRAGLIDQGTGSTWEALSARGFIEMRYVGIEQIPEIKITPKGRKAVRSETGQHAHKPRPKGVLAERQWAALVRLWQVGDQGIGNDTLLYDRGGFTYIPTIHRLVTYSPRPLIEYVSGLDHSNPLMSSFYRITEAGKAFYRERWQDYHERYPSIEAPAPDDVTTP